MPSPLTALFFLFRRLEPLCVASSNLGHARFGSQHATCTPGCLGCLILACPKTNHPPAQSLSCRVPHLIATQDSTCHRFQLPGPPLRRHVASKKLSTWGGEMLIRGDAIHCARQSLPRAEHSLQVVKSNTACSPLCGTATSVKGRRPRARASVSASSFFFLLRFGLQSIFFDAIAPPRRAIVQSKPVSFRLPSNTLLQIFPHTIARLTIPALLRPHDATPPAFFLVFSPCQRRGGRRRRHNHHATRRSSAPRPWAAPTWPAQALHRQSTTSPLPGHPQGSCSCIFLASSLGLLPSKRHRHRHHWAWHCAHGQPQ